jgi:predicted enzyme related to lactoylglutathione lyase
MPGPASDPQPDWARPLVHWEIRGRDPALLRAFYASLFNWAIEDGPTMTIPPGIGGPEPGPGGHIARGNAPSIVLYFQVRDLRASLAKAVALGGSVLREPFDVPGGPTIARIADPEGNVVALVQQ